MPLYRQQDQWKQLGLSVSRRTLANWMISASEWLQPIYQILGDELTKETILHADETVMNCLSAGNKTNYLWQVRTTQAASRPICFFHWDASRSRHVIEELLGGFQGYLHCDGYAAYSNLEGVTPVRCLAHARRKFTDVVQRLGKKSGIAYQVVTQMDQLFANERNWRDQGLRGKELIEARQKESLPRWRKLTEDLENLTFLGRSKLGEAVQYCRKFAKEIEEVFYHPGLSLDNNLAERSIRQIAIGRKNWLHASSVKGARASAIIFTILQTARENRLDLRRYIRLLLDVLPNLSNPTPADLQAYLPWSPSVQILCGLRD